METKNPYDQTTLTGYSVYRADGRLHLSPVDSSAAAHDAARAIGGYVSERWSIGGQISETLDGDYRR